MTKLTRFIDQWHENIFGLIPWDDFYEWSYNNFESSKVIYDTWSISNYEHFDYDPRDGIWRARPYNALAPYLL